MNLLEFVDMGNKDKTLVKKDDITSRLLGQYSVTIPDISLPVPVESTDWLTLSEPERLYRKFNFLKTSHVIYFVSEVLKYQKVEQHSSKITILELEVEIETYTHDINSVTELDIKLARFCDEVYRDTRFLDYDRDKS
jgi:pterin-4a-carbinolamine dehydratase